MTQYDLLIEYGHEEGGGLAGARLSARHQIPFVQYDRYGVLLHRRWVIILGQLYVVTDNLAQLPNEMVNILTRRTNCNKKKPIQQKTRDRRLNFKISINSISIF